jgi:O-antigen ligase
MFFLNNYFQSTFINRLLLFLELGTDNAREKLLKKGFDAFIDNPFFGKSMLFDKGLFKGSYPHNLIIEAFMATGLLGGLFFLFYIIKCFKISIKLIINNSQISWISLFFFQFLIFAMFSGNLFKSYLFWYSSILIITVSSEITNHKFKI